MEIRNIVRSNIAVPDGELISFFTLLTAIAAVAGRSLQDNIFPKSYSEGEFQSALKGLLRQNPRIGSKLEEHPRAGGGITDLSFEGIRLELKVDPDQAMTHDRALKFVGQTTQYVAGSDRRLGILAILDCSKKESAPGTIANDIFAEIVPPPSGNGFPICIAVAIIRGSLAKPSSV